MFFWHEKELKRRAPLSVVTQRARESFLQDPFKVSAIAVIEQIRQVNAHVFCLELEEELEAVGLRVGLNQPVGRTTPPYEGERVDATALHERGHRLPPRS